VGVSLRIEVLQRQKDHKDNINIVPSRKFPYIVSNNDVLRNPNVEEVLGMFNDTHNCGTGFCSQTPQENPRRVQESHMCNVTRGANTHI
jgi:hypothetical protein